MIKTRTCLIALASAAAKINRGLIPTVALSALAACSEPATPSTEDEDRQSAFRLRADFTTGLNADDGWAAELNDASRMFTDVPFRLRIELESPEGLTDERHYGLQYRRNGGEWEPMGAEGFPQNAKELELEYDEGRTGDPTDDWNFVRGDAGGASVESDGGGFLRLRAGDEPLLALGTYDVRWTPVEYAVDLRLPEGEQAAAGVVFGYEDPDNYSRVFVDTEDRIRVSRFVDGEERHVTEKNFDIATGRWFELKIIHEGEQVIVEYDDEALVFSADLGAADPRSVVGTYVPARSTAEFEAFAVEGMPRSPRVSVIAAESYRNGEETQDLLAGSNRAFLGGMGLSLAKQTGPWSGADGQSEWEWPLVIRRFADGAVTNNEGDIYEFRMADAEGEPLVADVDPKVTVSVPEGHIGGTFVETPGRIGPWEASNGDLYFLMEPAETHNVLMTVKSTDGGKTWVEVDGGNRPKTGDLEGFAATLDGATIHMLHQTSDDVWRHAFRTSDHPDNPDTWAVRDERLASPSEPPVQVADIAVRSDGSVVGVYGGPDKIHFKIRSPGGEWGDEQTIDTDEPEQLSGPSMALGRGDVVHLAYTANDGTGWYRRIEPDGSLTERQRLTDGLDTDSEDVGSILPLVLLPESNTVSIIYRLASGELEERRSVDHGELGEPVRVTDRKVVQNAVDADQTGADAIADGERVHVLFIEEETGHLYHTHTDETGSWQPASLQVDGENVQWVRGQRLKGGSVYGYVYDGGSYGGSGKNQYREVPL